ncbi:MAG: vWA domain-containing protein [Prevotella sp.]
MYENYFTRANPGLIVFLIDQSKSMEDPWSGGKTLAEQTALSINRCISEMAIRFTSGTVIKDEANIIMIGYGGTEKSMEAELLRSGSIATLCSDDTIPVQHLKQKISDGAGGILEIDVDQKEFITPKAVWGTPMASAFQLASALVTEWVSRAKEALDDEGNPITRDDSLDPVPLIINISDGEPTDNETDVRKYAREIMEINCPDGNPLIFNIHLSANGGQEVCMPMDDKALPVNDKMSRLLYEISSSLPESMVKAANEFGFPNAEAGAKTFMSNVTEVEKFVMFLNLGTKGTGGNQNIR